MSLAGQLAGGSTLSGRLTGAFQPIGAGGDLSLPYDLESTALSLRFAPDAAFGVRLLWIRNLAAPFAWENEPEAAGADHRLWEIRGTNPGGDLTDTFTLSPSDAASFAAHATTTPAGDPAVAFRWTGLTLNSGALDVVMLVELGAAATEALWRIYVTRTGGDTGSIDEVDCPRLWIRPPIAARAGSNVLEATKRAYVLTPNNDQAALFASTQASPAYAWFVGGTHISAQPAISVAELGPMVMQMAALAAMDPQDTTSYRQILHLGSRDTASHYKQFVLSGTLVGVTDARLQWKVTHFPPFGKRPLLDAEADASEFGNVYYSRFPAATGATKAASDDWQYDAAAHYRDWVERSGVGGVPRIYRRDRSTLKDGQPFVGVIHLPKTFSGTELFEIFLRHIGEVKTALDGTDFPVTRVHTLWQNWLTDGAGNSKGVANPKPPLAGGGPFAADEGIQAALATAASLGYAVAPYTEGTNVELDSGYGLGATAAMQLHNRDGSLQDAGRLRWDYGQLSVAEFLRAGLYNDLFSYLRPTGIYVDGLGGNYGRMTYPPSGGREHFAHGGSYWLPGKRAFFQALRDELALYSGIAGEPPTILTETVQEHLSDLVDGWHEGLILPPLSMLGGSEVLWPYSATDVPLQARNLTPPLWAMVYHRWSLALKFTSMLTTRGLETSADHPDGVYPGMAPGEYGDYLCYLHACAWISGYTILFQANAELDGFQLWHSSGGVVVAGGEDPEAVGLEIVDFIRTLHQALEAGRGGQWLVYGDFERGVAVDYTDPEVQLENNPIAATRKVSPAVGFAVYPSHLSLYYKAAKSTTLSDDALSGATEILVASAENFYQGDSIILDDGGANEETVTVAAHGVLGDALQVSKLGMAHLAGESVDRAETALSPLTNRAISEDFNVPRVLATTWRNVPGDRVCLAMVNWSQFSGSWRGVFDPSLYGFTDAVLIREVLAGGVTLDLGIATAATTLHLNGGLQQVGNDLYLGAVPPRSVRFIQFEQTPGSGYDSGFSSGFGPPFAPVLAASLTSGFDMGFDSGFGVTDADNGFDIGFSSGFGPPGAGPSIAFTTGYDDGFL